MRTRLGASLRNEFETADSDYYILEGASEDEYVISLIALCPQR